MEQHKLSKAESTFDGVHNLVIIISMKESAVRMFCSIIEEDEEDEDDASFSVSIILPPFVCLDSLDGSPVHHRATLIQTRLLTATPLSLHGL